MYRMSRPCIEIWWRGPSNRRSGPGMYVLTCASGGREVNRSSLIFSPAKERREEWGGGDWCIAGFSGSQGLDIMRFTMMFFAFHEIRLPILALLC